jgi:hypothetical protein
MPVQTCGWAAEGDIRVELVSGSDAGLVFISPASDGDLGKGVFENVYGGEDFLSGALTFGKNVMVTTRIWLMTWNVPKVGVLPTSGPDIEAVPLCGAPAVPSSTRVRQAVRPTGGGRSTCTGQFPL